MWDLVGNPEDRFSQNEAHIFLANIVKLSHHKSILVTFMKIDTLLKRFKGTRGIFPIDIMEHTSVCLRQILNVNYIHFCYTKLIIRGIFQFRGLWLHDIPE